MTDPTLPDYFKPVQARPVHVVTARPVIAPLSPLELTSVPRWQAVRDLLLAMSVGLILPLAMQVVAAIILADDRQDAAFIPVITVQKWFDVLVTGGVLAYLILRNRLSPACFGLRLGRPLKQLLWAAGSLGATYAWVIASTVVITFLLLVRPELQEDIMQRTDMIETMPVESFGWTTLLLIPVAVHEELCFRALLLPYLKRVVGSWPAAIVIASAIFAVLHFDQGWIGVIQILGVGTVLSIFFVRSRSLPAVIIAHFAFDFLQFQMMRFLPH